MYSNNTLLGYITLTGIRLSLLSKMISTKADTTRGPVPSCTIHTHTRHTVINGHHKTNMYMYMSPLLQLMPTITPTTVLAPINAHHNTNYNYMHKIMQALGLFIVWEWLTCRSCCLSSGLMLLNSSLRTNWIAGKDTALHAHATASRKGDTLRNIIPTHTHQRRSCSFQNHFVRL